MCRWHHAGFFKPAKGTEATREQLEQVTDVLDSGDGIADLSLSRVFPKHIIVAWWKEDITDLARSLAIFAPKGSKVTVISAEKPEVRAILPTVDPWLTSPGRKGSNALSPAELFGKWAERQNGKSHCRSTNRSGRRHNFI